MKHKFFTLLLLGLVNLMPVLASPISPRQQKAFTKAANARKAATGQPLPPVRLARSQRN